MSVAAQVFSEFQALVQSDAALHAANAEQFVKLMSFADDLETNVAVRAKIINFVAQSIAFYDASVCKKAAQLAVKLLAGQDSIDPILISAIKVLVSLASITNAEKRPDYFAREGADILIQVILADAADGEGYSVVVRDEAKNALEQLATINLKSVLTKLVHLISDDREADEAEQLSRERVFALGMLQRLSANLKSAATQWTEDVQQHFLTVLSVVLHTVTKDEFVKLLDIAGQLPVVKEKNFTSILESYLNGVSSLDSLRQLESVSILAQRVLRAAVVLPFPLLAEKLVALQFVKSIQMAAESADETQLAQLKLLVAASRLASAESAAPLLGELMVAIATTNVFNAETNNVTLIEGLLFALSNLGSKIGEPFIAMISTAELSQKLAENLAAVDALTKIVTFEIKKRLIDGDAENKPGSQDARCLAALQNISKILTALTKKEVPAVALVAPSWARGAKLPVVKRARDQTAEASLPSTAPAAKGAKIDASAKGKQQQQPQKQQQQKQKQQPKKPIGNKKK